MDFSGRNRLLNTPRHRKRSNSLEIIDELSSEIFRILMVEKRTMSFRPLKVGMINVGGDEVIEVDNELFPSLGQPGDDEINEHGIAARHRDLYLQTNLTSEPLQKRLLKIYYLAQMYEQEQGVNILYLALGFLKWFESEVSDIERYAPILLIPVSLERESARSRFKIRYLDEDISANLSLQAKMSMEFGIDLADILDNEELDPDSYFTDLESAIESQTRWEVIRNDAVFSFFSFAKFLMYRDLDPQNWPEGNRIDENELIIKLLKDGFGSYEPIVGDDEKIDHLIQPIDMVHVLDADSSQAVSIEEVRRGRNLVIQGPPGTGKSQTIVNLIATAVKEGKKVLFVAEKMAALEVVHRRLENIGLADLCLEIHSHKTSKKHVLEELDKTLKLGRPFVEDIILLATDLAWKRDRLNAHCERMHARIEPCCLTPFQIIGELERLRVKGIQPTEYTLEDAPEWTPDDVGVRISLLRDLSSRIGQLGPPHEHIWRGAEVEIMLPIDISRLRDSLLKIKGMLKDLRQDVLRLTKIFELTPNWGVSDISALAKSASKMASAPEFPRSLFASNTWSQQRKHIFDVVMSGQEYSECKTRLEGLVNDEGWGLDAEKARHGLATHGKSIFRFFNNEYNEAVALLRKIMSVKPPRALEERLEILDILIRGNKALDKFWQNSDIGKGAFGDIWLDLSSPWQKLLSVLNWVVEVEETEPPIEWMKYFGELKDIDLLDKLGANIAENMPPIYSGFREVASALKLDLAIAFECLAIEEIPLDALAIRIRAWIEDMESLTKWISFYKTWNELANLKLAEIPERIFNGSLPGDRIEDDFKIAYYEQLSRVVAEKYPEISTFDGNSHMSVIEKFKELDQKRIEIARQEVSLAHFQEIPAGSSGELGIIKREINKKRRHIPIRKLMSGTGQGIQAIKPVFMMSPMSVAQFLPPGSINFDLLLIDEASQVQPVDALGAISRTKQIVVVGDDKQLPPTRFFKTEILDEDSDEEEIVGDLESILKLCNSKGVPHCMLQWHYRSKHHSLIAVSNHEFYDDRLFVVPSPDKKREGMGVVLTKVEGVFDRGRTRSNKEEAKVVADAVMQHARKHYDLTLGVGTFSIRQRDAILDELEWRWREEPDVREYFSPGRPEPFFVKNLENIQGDERDIIFLSVGYGFDESGFFSMNFGPLSNEGGERRLNVLITRARQQCRVFSSILADDIDLRRATGRGPSVLKTYLKYIESGTIDISTATGRGFDSVFEEQVAHAIANYGYQVDPQVGVAGFFVDLGVVDPEKPGRYLLGIECDGASYHSSRWARDRDRLRQQVLEDKGWIIHRIWSADWFQRPSEELRKAMGAIENAKLRIERDKGSMSTDQDSNYNPSSNSVKSRSILKRERYDGGKVEHGIEIVPYTEARNIPVPIGEPHLVYESTMAGIVTEIVKVEGPVHQDIIAHRVSSLWGLARTGSRINHAVLLGISKALRRGHLKGKGPFLIHQDQKKVSVRNREGVDLVLLKKPQYLPPAELMIALYSAVKANIGISRDEAAKVVSLMVGLKSMSAQFRTNIEDVISDGINRGIFREDGRKLRVKDKVPDYL